MLWAIPAVLTIIIVALTWTCLAQEAEQKQKAFASPQAATQAFVAALRAGDKESLLAILGPKTDKIVQKMTRYNPDDTWKRSQQART